MKKYLVEFIGTFFFVLVIVCSVIGGAGAMAPIAIGSALMVMIYAGGHISGGHFNPAVTLAVFLRGKCPAADVPMYMIAQIAGAAVAALLATTVLGFEAAAGANAGMADVTAGMVAEFLGAFAICWVVLHTATAKGTEGNSNYGLAIGFTVTAMAYALGGISGGAFNPAVAVGISVAELANWSNIWVFLVGNLVAGAAAAFLFKFVNGDD